MIVAYPELVGAMAKQNIAKKAVAKEVGITPRTLYSKLTGETEFTLKEANIIHSVFFPDMDKETLFKRADGQGA